MMSLLEFFYRSRVQIWTLTLEHCWLVGMSMLLAILIGVPLGILITRRASLNKPILGSANIIQTIPSLALFGFLMPMPWHVELPVALGVILAGIRVATVITIGVATIAAAIGAGGLGEFIFSGLAMVDNRVILAGAIPAALMALAADFLLGWAGRRLVPSTK